MPDTADTVAFPPVPEAAGRGDRIARRILVPLLALLALILIVFYVVYTPSSVDGDSMEPALSDGDRILITHGYDSPARDDVIVYRYAGDGRHPERAIKRVIAVPGDVVEVAGGVARVNGVEEPAGRFIADPVFPGVSGPLEVPEGTVFVLGDNRLVSLDSRQTGPVPLPDIDGKVVFVWAPLGRVRIVR